MSKQFYAGHLLVLRISFVIGRERSGNNISLLLVMMYHLGVLEFAPMTIIRGNQVFICLDLLYVLRLRLQGLLNQCYKGYMTSYQFVLLA